jgi:hypothetical protein
MSLYFDISLQCRLEEDVSENILNAIRYVILQDFELDEHPSEKTWGGQAWKGMLAPQDTGWNLYRTTYLRKYSNNQNEITPGYTLYSTGSFLHDDSFHEQEFAFMEWVALYIEDGFTGYWREKYAKHPSLFYVQNGKLYFAYSDEVNRLDLKAATSDDSG